MSLVRVADHDPDQGRFWTDDWQAGEFEVEMDRRSGPPSAVYSEREFIDHLEAEDRALRASGQ